VDFVSHFAGESQIVAAGGKTLASRPCAAGERVVVADIRLEGTTPKAAPVEEFWIPELPPILRGLWYGQGAVGREYYLDTVVPHRRKQRNDTPWPATCRSGAAEKLRLPELSPQRLFVTAKSHPKCLISPNLGGRWRSALAPGVQADKDSRELVGHLGKM
jgi:hypothetical protein